MRNSSGKSVRVADRFEIWKTWLFFAAVGHIRSLQIFAFGVRMWQDSNGIEVRLGTKTNAVNRLYHDGTVGLRLKLEVIIVKDLVLEHRIAPLTNSGAFSGSRPYLTRRKKCPIALRLNETHE